jgi:hypothetical protein
MFGSVLVVIDHLTRMAIFPLVKIDYRGGISKKYVYKVCAVYMAFRLCWLAIETRVLLAQFGRHFGDA